MLPQESKNKSSTREKFVSIAIAKCQKKTIQLVKYYGGA
jgi:hypothetical protein